MKRNRKINAVTRQTHIRSWSRENEHGASQVVATLFLGTDSTTPDGRPNGRMRRSHERSRLADSPWH